MEELRIGDRVKVLLDEDGNFNDEAFFELGTIKEVDDILGYFIQFDDKMFASTFYNREELQKIDEHMNCDEITNLNEIILKLKELEKRVFKLENADDVNGNEIDWSKIANMILFPNGGDSNAK